jgi:hypothetical protein
MVKHGLAPRARASAQREKHHRSEPCSLHETLKAGGAAAGVDAAVAGFAVCSSVAPVCSSLEADVGRSSCCETFVCSSSSSSATCNDSSSRVTSSCSTMLSSADSVSCSNSAATTDVSVTTAVAAAEAPATTALVVRTTTALVAVAAGSHDTSPTSSNCESRAAEAVPSCNTVMTVAVAPLQEQPQQQLQQQQLHQQEQQQQPQ